METQYYLNQLKGLIAKTQNELNLEFDSALTIATKIFTEINKDRRVEDMQIERQKATARQLAFLKRLGVSIEPEKTTKQEASRLISKELRNGNNTTGSYSARSRSY